MLGEHGSASAPAPGFAGKLEGGGKLPRISRMGTWKAVPSAACPVSATGASCACRAPGPSGCHIPAMALLSRNLGQVWAEVEQGEWAALMLIVETGNVGPHPHPTFTSQYLLLLPLPGTLPHLPCQLHHGQKEVLSNIAHHCKAQPPEAL